MLGVQFHNGKSSMYHLGGKKHVQSASKLHGEKSLKYEQSKLISQDVQKILTMEIKKANELVQKIEFQLKKDYKDSESNLLNQLRQMEESIRRKNVVIRELQNEINTCKNGGKKNKIKGENLTFMVTQQIKCNSLGLTQLKRELDDKKKMLGARKKEVHEVYENYKMKCKNDMKEVISLTKFKEIQQKRKKQFQKMMKTKSNPKKLMSSIWEQKKQGPSHYERSQNRIKDTINHRTVAETALKTEKKRHKLEMNNFVSKLQFLKDEAELIQQKIRTKETQLAVAQKRFSQSRTRQEPILSKRSRSKLKTLT